MVVSAVPMKAAGDRTILTVLVKATYEIGLDGELSLAAKQPELAYGDEFYDDDPMLGATYESDLSPFKPRADIVVVGNAYAPGGTPTNALEVALAVGALSKRLLVVGDRYWSAAKGMPPIATKPEPFTEMSTGYTNAFGGFDEIGGAYEDRNPIGKGVLAETTKKMTVDVPLPNIENPDQPIKFWKDRPEPAGLSFIGRGWQPRAQLLGAYDEAWQENVAPALPEDFSSEYYNGAPSDQQIDGYLRGDETVTISNMHPQGNIEFTLPGLVITATVTKGPPPNEMTAEEQGAPPQEKDEIVALNLDTLVIAPNRRSLTMVWRGFSFVEDLTAKEVRRVTVDQASA